MNLGEKQKIGPREEKGGGKLLKKVEFDFVSGVIVLHKKIRNSKKESKKP